MRPIHYRHPQFHRRVIEVVKATEKSDVVVILAATLAIGAGAVGAGAQESHDSVAPHDSPTPQTTQSPQQPTAHVSDLPQDLPEGSKVIIVLPDGRTYVPHSNTHSNQHSNTKTASTASHP